MPDEQTPPPIEILLVDDNDDDIVLLEESLRDSRLLNVLHVLRDGEAALAYLRREGQYQGAALPGLVLLDINMPRVSGFDVLGAMKSDPALRMIPVVMLTTSSCDKDVARSYDGGACSFVTKPESFEKRAEFVNQFALYWSHVAIVPSVRDCGR